MNDDTELLRRFADEGSQEAFAELVRLKLNLVYAAALRQTGGDVHLAEEASQGVFLALARDAQTLKRHPVLSAWLYQTTRFLAAKAVRTQARWHRREREANTMIIQAREGELGWSDLRPVIDEAMHEIEEKDRVALLLRFFEGRSFAEVGAAVGLAENAARMRVDRALEKLHARLARRGITSTAVALGVALAHQPAVVVPAGLAATVLGTSFAGAALSTGGLLAAWRALDFMTKIKLSSVAALAFAAVGSVGYLSAQRPAEVSPPAVIAPASPELLRLRTENEQLSAEVSRLQQTVAASAAAAPLADLHALVSAVQQKIIPPIATVLRTNQGQLTPAIATLFALTGDEKTAFEKALADSREQLGVLAAANIAKIERVSPAKVVFRFGTYPDAGGRLHDRFLTEARGILGSARLTALTTMMGDRFDTELGSGFGTVERTLTFDRRPGGQPDRPMYQVTDRAEPLPGTFTTTGFVRALDRAGIEQNYPALAKLLPADF